MKIKLVRPVILGLILLFGISDLAARSEDNGAYTSKDKEFYLSHDEMLFIRPGLELDILDVTIPADLQTEVTFRISDPAGLGLDREGITTPGPVSTSFILSYIPAFEESYVAYTTRVQTSPITGESATQGTTDSDGSYTDLGDGTYLYKFGTVLPADYDTDVTHTLGMYARRDLREFDLDRYVANELDHFVPSGDSEPMPRDIVTTETCNARCHDPLAIHGGSRQEVGLCILCHNSTQDIDPDTGNSVDMPLMVHKIHMGEELTEGYTIIGYRQGVHDYTEVVYPADINECEVCHTGGTPTENFPMVSDPMAALVCDSSGNGLTTIEWEYTGNVEIRLRTVANPESRLFAQGGRTGSQATGKWVKDGTFFDFHDYETQELLQTVEVAPTALGCVSNAPGTFRGMAGMQHTNWLDHPSRKTCGSCHDYIDWETGEGHSEFGIIQIDDNNCANCHEPDSFREFDRSIKGAHKALYKSKQLPNPWVEFKEVINANPGEAPTVIYALNGKNAKISPSDLNRIRFTMVGPNEDFSSFYAQENAGDASVEMDGYWAYTFETPLPMDAAGSWTMTVEGRMNVDVMMHGEVSGERDYMENPVFAFAVTDAAAVPRRMVVDDYKCESCHVNLSLHGNNRHDPQNCNSCHRPDLLDIATPAESVHFKWMIHKIHRGEDLDYGYVVVRSRGTYDFSDTVFSGDLRNCDACHVNDSQQLPLPQGLLPTITNNNWWDPTLPQAAACLSCHDDDASAAHAYSNTNFVGESCSTCHGEGKFASVDKVHAQ